jgi:1-acyl-sn-glycerol-3-phosphate acyltransferase
MTLEEFTQQLRQTGLYETSAKVTPPRICWRGRGSFLFYLRTLLVVVYGRRAARRGIFTNRTWAECSYRTLRAVEQSGGHVSIAMARELTDVRSPVVYISNHMSMLETFLLPCILLPLNGLTTVVKKELLEYPLFGPILRATAPISVNRENPREDLRAVLEQGTRIIREGRSVLVFPQATRSVIFRVAQFNTLGVKLAGRAGVPAVPLALKTDFQGIGRFLRDFGPIDPRRPVQFSLGAPRAVAGNGRQQHEQVVQFICDRLRSWNMTADETPRKAGEEDHGA